MDRQLALDAVCAEVPLDRFVDTMVPEGGSTARATIRGVSIPRDLDGPSDEARDEEAVVEEAVLEEAVLQEAVLQEAVLIQSVAAGDQHAADELVRRYRGLIVGLARSRYGFGPQEMDDLLQSVMTLLWRDDFRALRAWRGQGRFSTYLSVIVCRECRRQTGLSRRRSAMETSAVFDEPTAPSPAPDQQTLANEQSRALRKALSELNPRDRLVLSFRFFDERRPSEFAPTLGLTVGAARKAVHDALGRLRQKLKGTLESGHKGRRD